MLVAFRRTNCSISAQKTTKEIFFTICWQFENTDWDSARAALQYANELLVTRHDMLGIAGS